MKRHIEFWWQRIGCIRNPGAHSGEESARDAEIRELRAYIEELEATSGTAPSDISPVPVGFVRASTLAQLLSGRDVEGDDICHASVLIWDVPLYATKDDIKGNRK